MRLDYALYLLAGLFFVITAIIFVSVAEENSRNLLTITTLVIGILLAVAGFFLRPKTNVASTGGPELSKSAPPQEPISEEKQKTTATAEETAPETPKTEIPKIEAPKAEKPPALETRKPLEALPPEPNAPALPEVKTETEQATVSEPSNLTKIRGINEKRAEQLRTIGVNSTEDLAKASSKDLAAKLQISEKIAKMWIGTAKKLNKK